MKPFASTLAFAAVAIGLASLLSAAMPPAQAQTRGEAGIREQYLADRAACLGRATEEGRQTCLREAGAAAQAARQGNLVHDEESYRRNALARCMPLPPEQREACRMRIEGAGTVRGSVEEGGLYRELRVREPAPPTVAAPDPAAPSTSVAPATSSPALPPVGAPGGPTFTPVQPVVPGRPAPEPAAVPADPSAATGATASSGIGGSPFSAPPPPSLQISPPASPVLQAPALPSGAPEPSMPPRPLTGPGSVPGSAQ